MDKQFIINEIYKTIKPNIRESENDLIEDYIPASLLPNMQRDLANLVEKLVRQGVPQPVQTAGRVVYAVKGKGKYFLLHISKNENELDEKIQNAYWMARGLQPSGNNYKVEDFMKDMEKVKVTIEKL